MTPPARPPASKNVSRKRLLAILLGLAISVGFTTLLIRGLDLGRVAEEIAGVNLKILPFCLLTSLAGFLAMSARSAVLLRPLHPFPPFRLFKSVLVAFSGNNVLPLRIGELMRVDYLARHGRCSHSAVLAVLAVERLLDLSCLVLLFFALLPLAVVEMPGASAPALAGSVVLVALGGLLWVARDGERFVRWTRWLTAWLGERLSGWLAEQVERFAEGLGALKSPGRFFAAIGCSWLYWLASASGLGLMMLAFDLELPWYAPAVVLVFITFGVVLPSAPAFIGTYHYFAMLALTLMGVSEEQGASYAIVVHAVGIVPFTLIGILLLSGEILRGELRFGRGATSQ
ncbi:MAG: lysylphosphatidylglycerol synthase transmembrane domain-containing protein [Acidobacteriota bacterium]